MNQHKSLVEKQYNEWVYPEPIADLNSWTEKYCQLCDPSLHHAIIWPDQLYNPAISILVAGCGTSQAAILAYTNPHAAVLGIDISQSALEHSNNLKTKHNLSNLELRHMDLHQVVLLKRKFDLIYATGVLHHLPNPQSGLEALTQVVKNNGVICVMLYAKYLRTGVYMIQEALRRLDIQQTSEGVTFTRRILNALPPWHTAQPYIRSATRDLANDGGVVDTFLHKQDRAFSVPDILALTSASNLVFQSWTDNLDYFPDGAFPSDHPAYEKIASLPYEEQWAIIELLAQRVGFHSFLVRKKLDSVALFQINFNSPDFLNWVPKRRYLLNVTEESPGVATLSRSGHISHLQEFEQKLFLAINGSLSCGTIIEAHAGGNKERAKAFFARMWKLGHLTYRYS